jgi:single-strand DNA-binding protein
MNRVVLVGRLTKDAEIKVFDDREKGVVNFTLAVRRDRPNSNNEWEVDFLPVVYWNKNAQALHKYLIKGLQLCVTGQIRVRSYETQEKGRRYITEILADEIKFLEKAKDTQAV